MSLRGWLKRLERVSREEMIEIPQKAPPGTSAWFTPSELRDGFMNLMQRMGAGEDAPPEHPVLKAVRNSSDPGWTASFYYVEDPKAVTRPVPDLSEP